MEIIPCSVGESDVDRKWVGAGVDEVVGAPAHQHRVVTPANSTQCKIASKPNIVLTSVLPLHIYTALSVLHKH